VPCVWGKWVRGVLPDALRRKIPVRCDVGLLPEFAAQSRHVLMLTSCVQSAMMPTIDAATLRVLDAIGISADYASEGGCCGAVNFHLNAQDAALSQMKAKVDAWWPLVETGAIEAIVMNASGCGAMVKEYAHHLRHELAYSQRAERIVALVKNIAEIVAPHTSALRERLSVGAQAAFHPLCTLQHW
jgi:glycolate oxidase iron-sulfur subunit